MPRLTKLRIVGCKYDGFRKSYQNSVFDLTRNNEPDHSLFTLKNQGGKGVLIQLLSQIAMPETRWGKQDGNKMTSFFYDKKGRFIPYTFHVILEWKLDSVPEKWLITGICLTSYIKASNDEDEKEQTGLRYFMYTYEHENSGYLTVETLPAYNALKGTAVDYEEYEKFIDEKKRDIVKYSQSSSKRNDSPYYKYLKSNGIFKSEWEILKLINKVEGGSSEYFSKASDNKSIFDKTIIPAITQNLKNAAGDEKSDLKEMFKSHLSITKNLPKLLEREDDYRYLIEGIKPVIDDVAIGIRRQTLYKNHIMRGSNLLFAINNLKVDNEKIIEIWKDENKRASEKKKELQFQMQSLEYMKIRQELQEYHKEQEKYRVLIDEKEQILKDTRHESLEYETSILLKQRSKYVEEKQKTERKKQTLMDSQHITEARSLIEALQENIDKEWVDLNKRWEDIRDNHYGYLSYLDNEISLLKDKRNQAEKQEKHKAVRIETYRQKQEKIEQRRAQLAIIHGKMQMQFPDMHIQGLSDELRSFEKKVEDTELSIQKVSEKRMKSESEISVIETTLKDKKGNLKQLDADFNKVREEEENLKDIICSELNLDRDFEVYTPSWLTKKRDNLEKSKSEKNKKLGSLKESLWELNIDLNINNADYWIPNPDAALLKEKVSSLNIRVQLGTEYLYNLENDEQRNRIIDENPLFIYGIVIPSKADIQIIRKNIGSDIFLKNAVPVFVTADISSDHKQTFEIIKELGFMLAQDHERFMDWKDSIQTQKSGTEDSIRAIEMRIEKLESLLQNILIIENKEGSKEISEMIQENKAELSRLDFEANQINQKLQTLKEQESSDRMDLKDQQKKLKQHETELDDLKMFNEELKDIESQKDSIDEEERQREEIERMIKIFKSEIDELERSKRNDESDYTSWYIEGQSAMQRLARTKLNPSFDRHLRNQVSLITAAPSYSVLSSKIENLLNEYEALNVDLEQKDSEIALVNKDLEYIQENILRVEGELSNLNKKWKEHRAFDISESEHQTKIGILKSRISDIEKGLKEFSTQLTKVSTTIEMLEKDINKKEKDIIKNYNKPPMTWNEDELINKEYSIEKGIEENDQFIRNTEDILRDADIKKETYKDILSDLKHYPDLDIEQGNLDQSLMDSISQNPQQEAAEWEDRYKILNKDKADSEEKIYNSMDEYKNGIEKYVKEQILKDKILDALKEIGSNLHGKDLPVILQTFESMKDHFDKEIITVSNDKQRAEEVRDQWAQRAARHVIVMVEALKSMIAGMTYENQGGFSFPLVKLSDDQQLPKNEQEITATLREYFIESIQKLIEEKEDIENIDDNILDKIMGDQKIFSRALRGRYPKLMVYKMTEKNEFRYSKPHESYYTTWEAINKGEGEMTEGSGGQTVSVHTFVIMMLMNYKKKDSLRQNPWTVLILDNPFGKASGSHMLDPIFEIADKLNFQIIAFAAPEIIKVDISSRFPVFWALKISDTEDENPGTMAGKVIHGGRVIKKPQ